MHKALGQLSTIHYGKSPSEVFEADGAFPVIGTGGEYGRACKSLFKEGVVVPRKGSLGNPQLAQQPFWPTDTTFAVIANQNVDVRWLYYSLLQYDLTRLNEATGVPSISREWLAKLKFFHTEYNNQKAISEVLATIDQAIEKTEVLIEKYQQIKAGLMHDLFTRGIGPDGKLRPPREQAPALYQETPIGWMPKGWVLSELGQYADICSGVTLGTKSSTDRRLRVPYLRVANVQDGYLDLAEVKEIYVNQKTLDTLRLQPGDVLMNEGGDFDKLGRGTVWQGEIEPCIHQNHVFRVRVEAKALLPFFLAYWSQSEFGKKYFVLSSKQSTNLASINSTQLHKFPVALPSMVEQEMIEVRIGSVNTWIEMRDSELQKLIKQKSGLMHDLLTGKVQVNPAPPETSHVQ
jgi:type I restriction enzyme S subunit